MFEIELLSGPLAPVSRRDRPGDAPKVRFATDSSLEGAGFELAVPRRHPASLPCRITRRRLLLIAEESGRGGLKSLSGHAGPKVRVQLPSADPERIAQFTAISASLSTTNIRAILYDISF